MKKIEKLRERKLLSEGPRSSLIRYTRGTTRESFRTRCGPEKGSR